MNTENHDIDILSAFIDGELDKDALAKVYVRLETDEQFKSLYESMKQHDLFYKSYILKIDEKPIPESLRSVLFEARPYQQHISFRERCELIFSGLLATFKATPALPALAIVLLISVGIIVNQGIPEQNATMQQVVSSPVFQQQLNQVIAGDSFASDIGQVTEVLAFQRQDGTLCKQLHIEADPATDVILCHTNGNWSVFVNVLNKETSPAYQLADGNQQMQIEAFIRQNISGNVLTREKEKNLQMKIFYDK